MRVFTLLAATAALAAAQDPKIDVAGWDTYTGPECQSAYQTPSCIKLTVFGDNFGTVQGTLQKGSLLPPAPPPPAQPWDTPAVLFPSDIANRRGGNGVCVARSLYTGDGMAYQFCPFQRVDHFVGAFRSGSLGSYAGVVRDFNNVNCPGSNAIVGMKFLDGSMCNGVPSTSTVTFVCVDVLGAGLVEWGTTTPMINAAETVDQCAFNLTLPLPGACDGPRFALCGSTVASPNPTPAPSPVITYSGAVIQTWADGSIVAFAPGPVPPPAVRVQRSDSVLSTAYEPEGPGSLPPTPSAVPTPFPSRLEIISMTPQQGVRGACTEVLFQLAGVNIGDLVHQFGTQFRVTVPTSERGAMNYQALGLPQSIDGQPPVAPRNGLLNVTVPCLNTPSSWPSFPQTVTITNAGTFWSQASLGTHRIREAFCQVPGCLSWTFLPAPGDVDGIPPPGTLSNVTGDVDAEAA